MVRQGVSGSRHAVTQSEADLRQGEAAEWGLSNSKEHKNKFRKKIRQKTEGSPTPYQGQGYIEGSDIVP